MWISYAVAIPCAVDVRIADSTVPRIADDALEVVMLVHVAAERASPMVHIDATNVLRDV